MSIPVILTVLFGMLMNYFVPDGGWIVFLLKAGVGAVLYMILMLLLGYSKAERKNLLQYIKR